jgi:DNA polymerase-3 subunit delta
MVLAEAAALGAELAPGALELLLAKVGANTRLLAEEVRKLATYAGQSSDPAPGGAREGPITIEEAHVAELTPNSAEGDFFEAAEAFCSGDLRWTLAALERHFFAGGDARPVIAALQNRNRLQIQIRALLDAGEIGLGARGIDGLSRAASAHGARFAEAAGEKSSFNVFAQNAWYLGKVAGSAGLPSLRRLIDNQLDLIVAFEEIIRRPQEQEEVMRELAVRCLAPA